MVTFLASILIWLMFFGLIVLWIIDGKIKKETVIHAIFSMGIAWVVTELIKYFFPTLRPFQVLLTEHFPQVTQQWALL